MRKRVSSVRLATGVPDRDPVLGGGVPEFPFNVIAGAPGAGKTTLVQQMTAIILQRYLELDSWLQRVMTVDFRVYEITAADIVVGRP